MVAQINFLRRDEEAWEALSVKEDVQVCVKLALSKFTGSTSTDCGGNLLLYSFVYLSQWQKFMTWIDN